MNAPRNGRKENFKYISTACCLKSFETETGRRVRDGAVRPRGLGDFGSHGLRSHRWLHRFGCCSNKILIFNPRVARCLLAKS